MLESGVAAGGGLRWVATDLTPVVESGRRRLDCSPLAASALGRCLVGAALLLRLAAKTPSRLLLEIKGDGPLGSVLADADDRGNLRGTVARPLAVVDQDHLSVAPGIGRGRLRVTRSYGRGFHTSEVELVAGEVGRDLAHYLAASEQVRSAVLLGVLALPTGIGAAGGMIVEALPPVDEALLGRLEGNVLGLGGVSRLLAAEGLAGLRDRVFAGIDHRPLETRLLRYRCRCSGRIIGRVLAALEPAERASLRQSDGALEAECSFCGRRFRWQGPEPDPAAGAGWS